MASKVWSPAFQGLASSTPEKFGHRVTSIEQTGVCEGCILGKQAKKPFLSEGAWKETTPLELVHADLCGPMQVESMGESLYFILFTDDYTTIAGCTSLN